MLLNALVSERLQRILRLAAICSWCLLTILSLLPGSERPHTGYSGNVEHATAYLLSGLATRLGFHRSSRLELAMFSLAAAFFEICQIYIPGRHPGIDNWAASSAGAAIGILIGRFAAHSAHQHAGRA